MQAAPPTCTGGKVQPVLLCLSHLRWDFVFQRPQHLMTRAAQDHEVIFFEEPLEAPIPQPRLDFSMQPGGVLRAVPVLPHGLDEAASAAAQRALLDGLLAERAGRPLVAWFYTPMALAFADHLRPDVTIYDCMDELSAFRGAPPAMLAMEQRLLDRADQVFTGGRSLFEAKRDRHRRVHCFPSSIDTAHFGRARDALAEPAALAGIPHPRIGFFGVIDERMDLALVAAFAALRPEMHLIMLGPVVKIDPASLPQGPNLHWLGGRRYDELPDYLAHWDLGFMPFALNESTRFISPTKTPEFLAAGLPVISTPVVDVVRDYGEAGLVEIVESAAELAEQADALLARPRAPFLARVDQQLAKNSWDMTWARMAALLRVPEAAPVAAKAKGVAHV
ncbi:glycosyltransferase [Falsiroseomonas sp.]|uniref:glycosyltransferase n=1 Tax=Falsiroseomonas sp. TaxID=2870721 RepID=UPI00271E96A5|nr:glycosyltransferase [Falsiroseomonas sp.]MDO9499802.1 glycosyltransferase [Falsiroseomonas sp.]MDP3414999.1 glycosyltransferase [Falsiroseomonas sp.]